MLSKELEKSIEDALMQARNHKHSTLTLEHLLLVLLDNPSISNILQGYGANLNRLRANLLQSLNNLTAVSSDDGHFNVEMSPAFQRVIQRAIFQTNNAGIKTVGCINVLAAILSETSGDGITYLRQEKITEQDIVNFILNRPAKNSNAKYSFISPESENEGQQDETLSLFTTNLNERALLGMIDPLIGRKEEIERVIQTLCRRRKNNPLLIGEAGVGKTAIAEGLARLIVEKKVPHILQHSVIYSLDLGLLVAGTKYRGDFEQRLKNLLNKLKEIKHAILFIDEIHTIIGAGASTGGQTDISNLIKPMLASGELTCMGSTTYKEYRSIFEKDHALDRRFQRIDVKEPSVNETIEMLKGLRHRFETHHQIKFTDQALEAAAKLSERYLSDRHLPDKAIDIIDEVGAAQFLLPENKRKKVIEVIDIEKVVAKIAQIPEQSISISEKEVLKNLNHEIKKAIYGQDEAVDAVTTAIKLARSGLKSENKPLCSFLFMGPTGVGKTEICNQLSTTLGVELIRFDMSEYMERHAVSRLIGAPPGYVGYNEGGLLTEAVNKSPYALILLDEIEKAHPDVFNLLLQIMDYGSLTDMNGRKADFRHTMLILTSNVGAQLMDKNEIGFVAADNTSEVKSAANHVFSPEFRNRLDGIIQFKPLDTFSILSVVDKFLAELNSQLAGRQVNVDVTSDARQWLAVKGYDKKLGARPMARLIQEQIKKPLAEELLFGSLNAGGIVKISVENENLKFEISDKVKSTDKRLI